MMLNLITIVFLQIKNVAASGRLGVVTSRLSIVYGNFNSSLGSIWQTKAGELTESKQKVRRCETFRQGTLTEGEGSVQC
jgi:hypothetical protein